MAVFKLFPEKDSFISTEKATANAGLDEILEVGAYPLLGVGQTNRLLIQFNQEDIKNTINNIVATPDYSASIHLSLAYASALPAGYTLYGYPMYESWTNGVGKFHDIPTNTSGVSWTYRNAAKSDAWNLNSLPVGVTGSYDAAGVYPGGGNWYTTANSINVEASITIPLKSDHDIDLNIKPGLDLHFAELIPNNGYILKLDNAVEFNTTSSIHLKYFGADTNTIYPPYLEFTWDDSVDTSSTISELSTDIATIGITNNKGKYIDQGVQKFRVSAKPKYPQRTFTTGSIYKTNYKLPLESYWGLKDEFTEEMVIDFNLFATKLSIDNEGSYFSVYMDGLQPERYYRILIKTVLDGNTVVLDDSNIFKVVRSV